MLVLDCFPPAFDEPSASPFSVKVMCLLQMAGAKWRANTAADVRKAPKRKLPVLHDGAEAIPDSGDIRLWLERRYDVDFDDGLDEAARARSHLVIRVAEEHLYWGAVYNRWKTDAAWAELRAAFFVSLKPPLSWFVPEIIRKAVSSSVDAQGLGRHTPEEAAARVAADLAAIRAELAGKPFLFGDRPTAADASAAPVIRALTGGSVDTPTRRAAMAEPVLLAYADRVKAAIYPPA